MNNLKQTVANAALSYVDDDMIVGVGTGSTTNYFIDALASIKHRIAGTVASSKATEERLRSHGIPVIDLNSTSDVHIYVDGADEVDPHNRLTKGGGGALTREKIVAQVATRFICIVDERKLVDVLLRNFPLPIEVIPMARSYIAREIVKLGGTPQYREQYVTDNGNPIIDVHHLDATDPITLEQTLNQLPGIISNGLFAQRTADTVLIGTATGVVTQ